ncbi:TetR/AcrR family transcriptional regulator [Rhodococcus sp. NPDC059968]|uniref:TetR/AcrR family transcriptional regulator n=1 Tax=Rhodococcus sp. NPDC059968 TaxID=3347017 RepID=UPI00366A57C9
MTIQNTHPDRPGAIKGPATRKGAATRARLVRAARAVFAEKGFIQTRITDIATAADSANGTFYIYFDSKETALKAVTDEVIEEFLDTLRTDRPEASDPATVIAHDNRQYILAYRAHADIMRVIEQVATFNDEFAELRRTIRERFVDRAARSIEAWQSDGLCPADFSPRTMAGLLVAMVDNFSYNWLSLGHPYADDEIADAMTAIWVRSMRLGDSST